MDMNISLDGGGLAVSPAPSSCSSFLQICWPWSRVEWRKQIGWDGTDRTYLTLHTQAFFEAFSGLNEDRYKVFKPGSSLAVSCCHPSSWDLWLMSSVPLSVGGTGSASHQHDDDVTSDNIAEDHVFSLADRLSISSSAGLDGYMSLWRGSHDKG